MVDNNISVRVTADASDLAVGMDRAAGVVDGATQAMLASLRTLATESTRHVAGLGTMLGQGLPRAASGAANGVRRLSEEMAQSAAKARESWHGVLAEIQNAEDVFIRDVLTKRQSLSRSLLQMSSRLVQQEIMADAHYYTTKLFYSALGLAADTKAAQGGLLTHLLAESSKTSATVAGNAARNASNTSSQSGFLGQIGQSLAKWLGFETAKTGATQGGDAARTASDTAAAAAGLGQSVARGFAEISIDASVAAAGTLASISAIPYVGPFMAPEMAAAAYGETLGWAAGMGGGVALAVGAWDIPTQMPATLHAGEMVVPADFASGLRAAGTLPGSGGGAPNVTFAPQISALDGKSVVALFNTPTIMRQIARNMSAYLANNPSVRGAY